MYRRDVLDAFDAAGFDLDRITVTPDDTYRIDGGVVAFSAESIPLGGGDLFGESNDEWWSAVDQTDDRVIFEGYDLMDLARAIAHSYPEKLTD